LQLQIRGSNKVVDQDPEGKYEALSKYARDLTAAAREGKLDPVIGRDDEIRRCIQILSRRTKNNPVLIGEPGGLACAACLWLWPHGCGLLFVK
jgi:ATP-dependent Clp protease ATP-binding subunit ClpB